MVCSNLTSRHNTPTLNTPLTHVFTQSIVKCPPRDQTTKLYHVITWPIYVRISNAKLFWTALYAFHFVDAKYFKSWASRSSNLHTSYFGCYGLTSLNLKTPMSFWLHISITLASQWLGETPFKKLFIDM